MNCFTRSIHGPGFGKKRSQAGCALSKKYGALIPAATATNIDKMTADDCVNANPIAVPRNGAVHGVANAVAKTPWKNEPAFPIFGAESIPRETNCGKVISNTPKRFNAKTRTMTLRSKTK